MKDHKYDKLENFEYETVIPDDFDIDAFKHFLDTDPRIIKYAFIIHDKDEDTKRHIHCMCKLNFATTIKKIADIMDCKEQNIERIKRTFANALAYLTHLNEPDKYHYGDNEVISNYSFKTERSIALNMNKQKKQLDNLIEAISNGEVPNYKIYEEADKLSINRSYLIANFAKIEKAIKASVLCTTQTIDRQLETIFITGTSGIGKTTFAKKIAKDRGLSIFISGSNNDFLDGYNGEECIIIDDVRHDTFKDYNDVLKLLDPHTASNVRSRYHNKIIKAELIIMTSTKSIDQVFYNDDEEGKQIRRRIKTLINIFPDETMFYLYDECLDEYMLCEVIDTDLNSWINEA